MITKSKISYKIANISGFNVQTEYNEKRKRNEVVALTLDGQRFKPSDRFWTSLYSRFGFTPSIFKYFDHAEVFDRIQTVEANSQLRLCVDSQDSDYGPVDVLHAVSHPEKPLATFDSALNVSTECDGFDLSYSGGMLRACFTPKTMLGDYQIGADWFKRYFVMDCPIDGYGVPSFYLSLLRRVCSNGAVAFAPAFKSQMKFGKKEDDVRGAITRMIESFTNEEGFVALTQRFQSAQSSPATLYEVRTLEKVLKQVQEGVSFPMLSVDGAKSYDTSKMQVGLRTMMEGVEPTIHKNLLLYKLLHKVSGDMQSRYGLANFDSLSEKRQRTMPANCTMYDLINFATEIATHHCTPDYSMKLHAWVGNTLSNEFDMEGTLSDGRDFESFFVDKSGEAVLAS